MQKEAKESSNEKEVNNSQIIEVICGLTEGLLEKMSLSGKVRAKIVDQDNEEIIWVSIENKENPNLLIGQRGSNLNALQHLLRLAVRRKVNQVVNFILDVNKYRENRMVYLQKLAQTSAERVVKTKKPLILEAMPAYERRIIHLFLAESEEVATESEGEQEERRVIIKPKEE